jgi:hypothetical protein
VLPERLPEPVLGSAREPVLPVLPELALKQPLPVLPDTLFHLL